jgi:melibiase-like protein
MMRRPLKRRQFIKTISLAGASIGLLPTAPATEFLPGEGTEEIQNNYFTVSFDKRLGAINIYTSNGVPMVTRGVTCANYSDAQPESSTRKHFVTPTNYRYSIRSDVFSDKMGRGKKMIIQCTDMGKVLDFEIQLALYDELAAITIETICKNVSGTDIFMNSLEPLRVIKSEGGILNLPGVSKCLTNGEMYYDTGTIHQFGNKDSGISSGNLKGVTLSNALISSNAETIHSWWNAGFFSGYEMPGLVIGYLANNLCFGNLLISKTGDGEISFLTESAYTPHIALEPNKSISSNRVMINSAEDPYIALETFATAAGKINNARIHSLVNGWCSWFYTLSKVSENEVLLNTEFASKYLKQFGLEYIQIDEGYQRWHGDWQGNERFPHGMKWLANKIKAYGFKPGIWVSPYVISEPTVVFQNHPEWLLKNTDGSLKRVGNWPENAQPPADENPKRYCLDITHPEAAKWLHGLIETIVDEWGYEMIKIDFVAWSILAADRYHDPTMSSAEVYRRGLEIMRDAAGEKCHILDCGPGATTVGLIDSMRIEADVNYGFSESAWDTYFLHEASSASAAAKRYYFHKRTWINDVDHICIDLLHDQQAQAAATIIAMSGGNMISGDRLTQLDISKLEIIKKILPSSGEAATPVDLFDSDRQSVFVVRIKRQFGEWTIAAFFNPSLEQPVEKRFSLKRLWLDPHKTYLAFDFWKQQFVGEITGEVNLTIEPGSVTLLSVHEKAGKPQFVSTDRHVTQGAIEIENVNWDETEQTYFGTSRGPLHSSHSVSVYIPQQHAWTWSGSALFRDHDSYSLKLVNKNIIRVHVNFEKSDKVKWEINMKEFFS